MQKIFGKKPVIEFLKLYKQNPNIYKIYKIYIKNNFSKNFVKFLNQLNLLNYVETKTEEEIDKIIHSKHQGIVIFYQEELPPEIRLKNHLLRPPKNLPVKQVLATYHGVYVLTDRIQDPHNLGSIIRTSEALGAMGIFITGKGARINPTVERVATSSLLYISCFEFSNAHYLIKEAKKYDYYILASTTKTSQKSIPLKEIYKIPKSNKYLLLVGSESDGLKPILLKNSDYWLEIPLLGKTESLNVNQALSILLYELLQYIY